MKSGRAVLWALTVTISLTACAGQRPVERGRRRVRSDMTIELYCSSDNDAAVAFYNEAGAFMEQDSLDAAVASYRRAIETDPGYCDAMDNLGVLYRRMGLLDSAIAWYRRSLAVNAENPLAHQNLGLVYTMQKKYDEARAEYRAIIAMDSDNPEGYYGVGHMLAVGGNPKAAIGRLLVAESLYVARLSPVVIDARRLLALCHMDLRDWNAARLYWEKTYQVYQDDPEVNFMLGMCCLRSSPPDPAAADVYLQRARRLGRSIPEEIGKQLNW